MYCQLEFCKEGLNRLKKAVPQPVEWNKGVEVRSNSGFWNFHKEGVAEKNTCDEGGTREGQRADRADRVISEESR